MGCRLGGCLGLVAVRKDCVRDSPQQQLRLSSWQGSFTWLPLVTNLWACHIICRQPEVPPACVGLPPIHLSIWRIFKGSYHSKQDLKSMLYRKRNHLLWAIYQLFCELSWEATYFMCHVLCRALFLKADALETWVYLLTSNQDSPVNTVIYIQANGSGFGLT